MAIPLIPCTSLHQLSAPPTPCTVSERRTGASPRAVIVGDHCAKPNQRCYQCTQQADSRVLFASSACNVTNTVHLGHAYAGSGLLVNVHCLVPPCTVTVTDPVYYRYVSCCIGLRRPHNGQVVRIIPHSIDIFNHIRCTVQLGHSLSWSVSEALKGR